MFAAMIGGLGGLGGLTSCLLDIDERLSCGDGYVSDKEECDPHDPETAYLEACRARGFAIDAVCDPSSCRIRASDHDCNVCGDGVAADGEECDGEDLRGETCPSAGAGRVKCTSDCRWDYDECPAKCNDGIVHESEECDPGRSCNDGDCRDGVCWEGLCISPKPDFDAAHNACAGYLVGSLDVVCEGNDCLDPPNKTAFSSGEMSPTCDNDCRLGRQHCGFCGDGVLDPQELELTPPGSSESVPIPGEFCDGVAIGEDDLVSWCQPICGVDLRVRCDFECKNDCSGFVVGGFVDPDPHCCLIRGEPCEDGGLPCCTLTDADPGDISFGTCKPASEGLPAVCH